MVRVVIGRGDPALRAVPKTLHTSNLLSEGTPIPKRQRFGDRSDRFSVHILPMSVYEVEIF